VKFKDTLSEEHRNDFLKCCENDLQAVLNHFDLSKSKCCPYELAKSLKMYINLLDKNNYLTSDRKKSLEEKFKENLSPSKFNHYTVRQICKDHHKYDIEDCILIILTWGQIRPSPTTLLLAWKSLNSPDIKRFLEDIRSGKENERKIIYTRFADYRYSGELKGIDTAYFTKLIYFLMNQDEKGYILDQFTARSSNILLRRNIININEDGNVMSKKNDAEVYEKYCKFIEDLTIYLDDLFRVRLEKRDARIEPEHAEIFIFYDKKDTSGWRSKAARIFEENKSDLLEIN
tara:strand:+ start:3535 stop:4398 length:864 start_codon:yes stop_codon:yes gene_type:complete